MDKVWKKMLVELISNSTNVGKIEINDIITLFLEQIKRELEFWNYVLLKWFWKFYKKTRTARVWRDPRNWNQAFCPESSIVWFKQWVNIN